MYVIVYRDSTKSAIFKATNGAYTALLDAFLATTGAVKFAP